MIRLQHKSQIRLANRSCLLKERPPIFRGPRTVKTTAEKRNQAFNVLCAGGSDVYLHVDCPHPWSLVESTRCLGFKGQILAIESGTHSGYRNISIAYELPWQANQMFLVHGKDVAPSGCYRRLEFQLLNQPELAFSATAKRICEVLSFDSQPLFEKLPRSLNFIARLILLERRKRTMSNGVRTYLHQWV